MRDLNSSTSDWTYALCSGARGLNHWTTGRSGQLFSFWTLKVFYFVSWLPLLQFWSWPSVWLLFLCRSPVFFSLIVSFHSSVSSVSSVQFSRSVVSDSLRPHESQHTRPPCPSPTPGVHSNSRPSSWWCHPAISSSAVPFSSCSQSLPVFSNESTLHMRWPKSWSLALASFLPRTHRTDLL